MGNIVLLDELTINKIAAGEVVERPASVIKEMVENSIDAGATSINVEIRSGGISYIRITDNGKGISKDDMELSFERHATSKIRSAGDLDYVKSMGFRGEALASIAAIANVEMISKTMDESIGNRIVVEAGQVLQMEEIGCPTGTTITVQNLFFNTPVRYKFLKKDYTESGYIEDVVTRLALINPNISFKLINTGKTVIQTSGNGNIQDVIYAIYGKDIASSILEVDYTYEDLHITGVVGKPEIARSNRANQLFFVNKRFVKDKTLSGAAEKSFKGLLPIGKYGFLILNIEMDPSKVDVNVHPAKLEVRFQDESKIFKSIYHAIKETLLKSELIANTEKPFEAKRFEDNVNIEPTKPSITDLFRKIKKEEQAQQISKENNVIEDIFNKKENQEDNEENKQEVSEYAKVIKEEVEETPSVSKIEEQRMDVFKELIAMQKRLKEEAENDPNLNTDVDQLIQKTQQMEEELNVNNREEKQPELEKEISENFIAQETPEIQEMPNILQEPEENYEVIKQEENQVTENTTVNDTTINEYENIKNDEAIEKDQNTENIEDIENTESVNETVSQDTKDFTSEEIKEMIDQLNKMEDIKHGPEFSNMYQKIFGKLPASVEEEQKEEKEKISAYELIKDNNVSMFEQVEEYKKPTYKYIGTAFNTYIIIEIEKELYLIDQHAAHERIMYEKVKENYYSNTDKGSQMLLLPDVITLTHREMDILKDNNEMFEKAGFVLEEFGENTIKLSGVPNICLDLDTKELFLETLDEINTVARTAKQEIEERFIATVACKAAVKANMDLTVEEIDNLMNDLLVLPNPFTCPHGRPTAIRMSQSDIEKKFARRK